MASRALPIPRVSKEPLLDFNCPSTSDTLADLAIKTDLFPPSVNWSSVNFFDCISGNIMPLSFPSALSMLSLSVNETPIFLLSLASSSFSEVSSSLVLFDSSAASVSDSLSVLCSVGLLLTRAIVASKLLSSFASLTSVVSF